MTYDRSVEQVAYYYLAMHKIESLPLTLGTIERMICAEGYQVSMYATPAGLPPELREFADMAAIAYIKGKDGHVYGNVNFSIGERLFALAHELGHIVLHHIGIHACGAEAERIEDEADAFALALLAPPPVLWYYGVRTVEGAQGCTLLPPERARQVVERLRRYSASREEVSVLARFWKPITPTRPA